MWVQQLWRTWAEIIKFLFQTPLGITTAEHWHNALSQSHNHWHTSARWAPLRLISFYPATEYQILKMKIIIFIYVCTNLIQHIILPERFPVCQNIPKGWQWRFSILLFLCLSLISSPSAVNVCLCMFSIVDCLLFTSVWLLKRAATFSVNSPPQAVDYLIDTEQHVIFHGERQICG